MKKLETGVMKRLIVVAFSIWAFYGYSQEVKTEKLSNDNVTNAIPANEDAASVLKLNDNDAPIHSMAQDTLGADNEYSKNSQQSITIKKKKSRHRSDPEGLRWKDHFAERRVKTIIDQTDRY